ncbi:Uncharacterised protein [Klebsiella pneumoniae]|nr:Uncharacterised protein [Klebsiella pneumoniae]
MQSNESVCIRAVGTIIAWSKIQTIFNIISVTRITAVHDTKVINSGVPH